MNKIFKYASLAIFLINNGWASANQMEATEASLAEAEHSMSSRGTGIDCYPGDCCEAFRQYVGDTLYPVQGTAPGTVCKAGSIVHAYECSTPCTVDTPKPKPTPKAPTERPPTQRPPTEKPPTEKPPTAKPPTQRPPTEKPPTEKPPTAKPPTQRPPTEKPPTEKPPTQRPPTEKPPTEKPPTEKPPTEKPPTVKPPTAKPPTPKPPPTQATTKPTGLCDLVPTTQEPLKFLVPLYVYPSSGKWDIVAEGAKKVPTVAIVNPNNGPTAKPNSDYTAGMNKLKAANVEMVGYVYTSYADRPISDCKKDIDTWKAQYPHITGIFFDEASNKAADIPYYRELYNYVLGKGYVHSIVNPGTQPDAGYAAISTNIMIFETYGNKWADKKYPDWVKCAPNAAAKAGYKYKFSGVGHSVNGNTASTALIKEMQKAGFGMVYITDGTPDTSVYNPLPSYYNAQISDIQKINNE